MPFFFVYNLLNLTSQYDCCLTGEIMEYLQNQLKFNNIKMGKLMVLIQ